MAILEGNWQNEFGSFEPGLRKVIHCRADAAFQAGTLRGNGYPHCKIGKNVTVRGTIYENPELALSKNNDTKPNTHCTSACGNDYDCPHEEESDAETAWNEK
jgi:hypothetical protein